MSTNKVVLALDVLQDIKRHFISYLVLLLVVLSAFAVIYFTHINRQSTIKLDQLLTERDELDIEYRNLLLEQSSLSEHSVIESKAEKQLDMKRPSADSEVIIKLP